MRFGTLTGIDVGSCYTCCPQMADSNAAPNTPWRDLCFLALIPALDAVFRMGRIHPDEVFQFLEPALNRAFGFGIMAWEWQVGLRNWFVPGLFSYVLRALNAVGLNDVQVRRAVLEVPQYALQIGLLGAVFRLSARRVSVPAARLAVWLVGLYPVLIWFGGRTMGESFSAAALGWGLERLDAKDERSAPFVGGLLLGLAEVTRYGSAAVIIPAMGWLLVSRRWWAFASASASGLLVALALGVLDLNTWGHWFHSLRTYVDFNVLSGAAAQQFGASPWHAEALKVPWYFVGLIVAPWAVAGFVRWFATPRLCSGRAGAGPSPIERNPFTPPWIFVMPTLCYLLAISLTPHKELRFIYPALVLLTMSAAPATAQWLLTLRTAPLWQRASGIVLLAATALLFVVKTPFDVQRPEQFQLTLKAGRSGTGLVVMNEGVWGSGGFFYLGQNLPWCTCDFPHEGCFQNAARDPRFNRGLFWKDNLNPVRNQQSVGAFVAAGFHVAEERGEAVYFERP